MGDIAEMTGRRSDAPRRWRPSPSSLLVLLFGAARSALAMTEDHRMEEYRRRGHRWPLERMVPETPGWRAIFERRFKQVERVMDTGMNFRYSTWYKVMTAALVKNYTENGWGLTRAPDHILRRLQERLHRTLEVTRKVPKMVCDEGDGNGGEGECAATYRDVVEPTGGRAQRERFIESIEASDSSRPFMIKNPYDNADILEEMRPMFEWWTGLELEGSIAYGIRAYRNNSNLLMHWDKLETHVISGIFHVDRSDDAEPWPIVIEDLQGNTNQVYLEPGDLLFYESSKCFHGRPQTFIGSYYASIFMHYRPVGYPVVAVENEVHYAVPEHWHKVAPPEPGLDKLVTLGGTSFKEPNCKNLLCSLDESNIQSERLVNWHGPAPRARIVTTGWDPVAMKPPSEWEEDGRDGGKGDASRVRRVLRE